MISRRPHGGLPIPFFATRSLMMSCRHACRIGEHSFPLCFLGSELERSRLRDDDRIPWIELDVLRGLSALNHLFVIKKHLLLFAAHLTQNVDLFRVGEWRKTARI